MLKGPPVDPSLRYSTPTLPWVAIPSTLETRLGTLRLGGVSDAASTDKLLDNLDFQRAVQATLLGLSPVNQLANRSAILTMGPANSTVELTANDNTPYTWFWLDLRQGLLVLEVPPKLLGLINDMWCRARRQVSAAAPRLHRAGAQWLLSGASVHLQHLGSLAEAGNPTTPTFVNMSGKPFAPDATARALAFRMRDRQGVDLQGCQLALCVLRRLHLRVAARSGQSRRGGLLLPRRLGHPGNGHNDRG